MAVCSLVELGLRTAWKYAKQVVRSDMEVAGGPLVQHLLIDSTPCEVYRQVTVTSVRKNITHAGEEGSKPDHDCQYAGPRRSAGGIAMRWGNFSVLSAQQVRMLRQCLGLIPCMTQNAWLQTMMPSMCVSREATSLCRTHEDSTVMSQCVRASSVGKEVHRIPRAYTCGRERSEACSLAALGLSAMSCKMVAMSKRDSVLGDGVGGLVEGGRPRVCGKCTGATVWGVGQQSQGEWCGSEDKSVCARVGTGERWKPRR